MPTSYELRGDPGVSHLRLDDGKANALNDGSCAAIEDAISRAGSEGAGALVIWGRDGVFSGGIDLHVLRDDDASARGATLSRIARTMLALWTAPLPTVAAVTGHAIAGGAVLAMACDRRIALDDDSVRIGLNETALGMVLPTWALVIAQAAIRPDRLTDTMLLGRVTSAAEAAETGIVEVAVPQRELVTRVESAATEAATLPTTAYAGTKRKLRGRLAAGAEALVDREMGGFTGPTEGRT